MAAVLTAPIADAAAKEYWKNGHRIFRVPPEAMGYVEAAREVCGNDDSRRLLEIVTEATWGMHWVRLNLLAYGRFEYNVPPDEIMELFRDPVTGITFTPAEVKNIMLQSGIFWNGAIDRRNISRR